MSYLLCVAILYVVTVDIGPLGPGLRLGRRLATPVIVGIGNVDGDDGLGALAAWEEGGAHGLVGARSGEDDVYVGGLEVEIG